MFDDERTKNIYVKLVRNLPVENQGRNRDMHETCSGSCLMMDMMILAMQDFGYVVHFTALPMPRLMQRQIIQ